MLTLPHGTFFEIFASGRYHRDMKILKIKPLTPTGSELMAFLKNDNLMIIEGWPNTTFFLDNFCLKQPLVLKIPLSMFFDSKNSKMTSKLL